jgi:hypothetical protein
MNINMVLISFKIGNDDSMFLSLKATQSMEVASSNLS